MFVQGADGGYAEVARYLLEARCVSFFVYVLGYKPKYLSLFLGELVHVAYPLALSFSTPGVFHCV